MKKAIKRTSVLILGVWVLVSFIDFNLARTSFGGMRLSEQNILVVGYQTLDYILKGFMF